MAEAVVRAGADLLVTVRVTPRADRDAVGGPVPIEGGGRALSVRVRAVPEDGRANAAVVAALAAALGIAKGRVRLVSGATKRVKRFQVTEADEAVEAALRALLG